MTREPPNRREHEPDQPEIGFGPGFDASLAEFVPDPTQRFYFVRDAIEWRLQREWRSLLIGSGPQGALVTEPGYLGVAESLIWFRVEAASAERVRITLERAVPPAPRYQEEDDS